MSIECLNFAIQAKTTRASDKLVLMLLANYAGEGGMAFPCIERLTNDSCLDRKTVLAAIKRLLASGLISDTHKRIGRTDSVKIYRLNISSTKNGTACDGSSTEIGGKQSQKRPGSSPKNGTHNHQLTNKELKDLLGNKGKTKTYMPDGFLESTFRRLNS